MVRRYRRLQLYCDVSSWQWFSHCTPWSYVSPLKQFLCCYLFSYYQKYFPVLFIALNGNDQEQGIYFETLLAHLNAKQDLFSCWFSTIITRNWQSCTIISKVTEVACLFHICVGFSSSFLPQTEYMNSSLSGCSELPISVFVCARVCARACISCDGLMTSFPVTAGKCFSTLWPWLQKCDI